MGPPEEPELPESNPFPEFLEPYAPDVAKKVAASPSTPRSTEPTSQPEVPSPATRLSSEENLEVQTGVSSRTEEALDLARLGITPATNHPDHSHVNTLSKQTAAIKISQENYERARDSYLNTIPGTTKEEFERFVKALTVEDIAILPQSQKTSLNQARLALMHLSDPHAQLSPELTHTVAGLNLLGNRVGVAGHGTVHSLTHHTTEQTEYVVFSAVASEDLRAAHNAPGSAIATHAAHVGGTLGVLGPLPSLALGISLWFNKSKARTELKELNKQLSAPAAELPVEVKKSLEAQKAKLEGELSSNSLNAADKASTGLGFSFSNCILAYFAKCAVLFGAALVVKVGIGLKMAYAGIKSAWESIQNAKKICTEIKTLDEKLSALGPADSVKREFLELRRANLTRQLASKGWLITILGAATATLGSAIALASLATLLKALAIAAGTLILTATPIGWIILGTLVTGLVIGAACVYLMPGKMNSIKKWRVEQKIQHLDKEINETHLQLLSVGNLADGQVQKTEKEELEGKLSELRNTRISLEKELNEIEGALRLQQTGDKARAQKLMESPNLNEQLQSYIPALAESTRNNLSQKILAAIAAPVVLPAH